ncbi:MAG: hypothetical protein WC798_03410 [Candidatus Paceibacterota bacterium]|jgi:hypothetical protein
MEDEVKTGDAVKNISGWARRRTLLFLGIFAFSIVVIGALTGYYVIKNSQREPVSEETYPLAIITDSCVLRVSGGNNDAMGYVMGQRAIIQNNERLVAECEVVNQSEEIVIFTPHFTTRQRFSSEKLATSDDGIIPNSSSLSPQEKRNFIFSVPKIGTPQFYDVDLVLLEEESRVVSNTVTFHYTVVAGASMTIQDLTLDKGYYGKGDTAEVSMVWASESGNFQEGEVVAETSLTDAYNVNCSQPVMQELRAGVTEVTLTLPVIADCVNPKVGVTVKDTNGNVLGQKHVSTESSARSVDVQQRTALRIRTIALYGVAAIVLISFLVLTIFWFMKKRNTRLTLLFVLGIGVLISSILMNASAAQAAGSPCKISNSPLQYVRDGASSAGSVGFELLWDVADLCSAQATCANGNWSYSSYLHVGSFRGSCSQTSWYGGACSIPYLTNDPPTYITLENYAGYAIGGPNGGFTATCNVPYFPMCAWNPQLCGQLFNYYPNAGDLCTNTWSPGTATVCSGQAFTQVSDCGQTRSAVGTKSCSVDGACGSASGRVYAYGSSSYSPYAQCSLGSPSTTAFPSAGNAVSWTCSGSNGGSPSGTCSASQSAPASCALPWGGSIASGSSATAYLAPSVTSPATCTSQTRTCTNGVLSGSYTNQNCVVTAPAPTATLTASPNPAAYSSRSTLTWSSTNATSCTAGGPWSNSGRLAGRGLTNYLTSDTTFTFQCTGPGGASPLRSVTVTVTPPTCPNGADNPLACTTVGGACINGATNPPTCTIFPPPVPTATLSVDEPTIDSGQSTTLRWNSTNATSCTGYGFTAGGTSGSSSTGTLTNPPDAVSYQVECTGPGGTSPRASASVTVLSPDAQISANPARVQAGDTSEIEWSASGVTSCEVTDPSGNKLATGNAEHGNNFSKNSPYTTEPITGQSTFTIVCKTNGEDITDSVTVNIVPLFQEF